MTKRLIRLPALLLSGLMVTATGASAQTPKAPTPPPAVALPPAVNPPPAVPLALVPVPFNEAIRKAATALMANVPPPTGTRELVIDPLIDGYTGAQNIATVKMGRDITSVIRQGYAKFAVQPFTAASVSKQPLVLIGTFRPINTKAPVAGPTDAYHICLAMLDLQSGKIVSKGVARATPAGVDATPTAFFQDSPAWTQDESVSAYVKSCQTTKVGDSIDKVYLDRINAASLISDAIMAYDARKYKDALELYQKAAAAPGGDQLRVHNGIFLANWKLNKPDDAATAFGKVVDFGLKGQKLAVNFLFAPATTLFAAPRGSVAPYPMYLKVIADRSKAANACLEIVGHTSKPGLPEVNERLSVLRAQYVRARLVSGSPDLAPRAIATGVGSRETIVGTLRDSPENAVDRRVEFKTIKCAA